MKIVKDISWEKYTEKVSELCEAIDNFDESILKSDLANFACRQIVTWTADSYYEGLGILQEAMAYWREEALAAMEDESESIDKKQSQLN